MRLEVGNGKFLMATPREQRKEVVFTAAVSVTGRSLVAGSSSESIVEFGGKPLLGDADV